MRRRPPNHCGLSALARRPWGVPPRSRPKPYSNVQALLSSGRIHAGQVEREAQDRPTGRLADLRERLLGLGGWWACLPRIEEDLERLLADGRVFKGRIRKLRGRPSSCHQNAANLWDHDNANRIVTGYGLSDDGIWRPHSWAVRDGAIIETTESRKIYFGFELTGSESAQFWFDNAL
jgi:hypothetical protein